MTIHAVPRIGPVPAGTCARLGRSLAALALVAALPLALAATPRAAPLPDTTGAVHTVDCDAGDSLAAALDLAQPGATVEIHGTCSEQVRVTVDRLTLDGGGEAVIDGGGERGPVLHVDGARDLTVRGLTVRNGSFGILAEHLATLVLEDVVAHGNSAHGIEVIHSNVVVRDLRAYENGRVGLIVNRNSELRLIDSVMEENGISGLVLFGSAVGRLEGRNVIRGNGDQGFTIGLGAMLFTIGAELVIEENGAEGFAFLQGGMAQFLGGSLEVRGNAADGIALEIGSTLVLGMDEFMVQGEVLVEDNVGHGISVRSGSHLVSEAIMPITARGNGGDGLHVDGGTATLAGETFEGNDGAGVALDFGARVQLVDVSVDEVVCDQSALLRGDVSCP
jgi:hypothetical protein